MIKIVDEAVPWPLFRLLKSKIDSPGFLWKFNETTAYGDDAEAVDAFDFSWSHMAVKDTVPTSNIAEYTRSVVVSALKKFEVNDYIIVRARYGLITAFPESRIHEPHVDYCQPHKTLLMYFNDTDGPTYFYENMYREGESLTSKQFLKKYYPEGCTVEQTVMPKENRAVLFDGLRYHASSTPTLTASRVVLNANIFPEFGNIFKN